MDKNSQAEIMLKIAIMNRDTELIRYWEQVIKDDNEKKSKN